MKIAIFNEHLHEKSDERVSSVYPEGIHGALASFLKDENEIRIFTLENIHEVTDEVLNDTDVMLWWGHIGHQRVPDEVAIRVKEAVLRGMGMVFLHSAHHSKPFRLLMGTMCNLTWREDGDMERVWTVMPSHPIAQGIGRYFELPHVETYGEPFTIPNPDDVVFIGWYEGGEVFRSGVTFHRENGKVFYFQPGHETFPIFYDKNVQTIIRNAVNWAKPLYRVPALVCPHVKRPGEE